MSAGHAVAIGWFAFRSNLRSPMTRIGMAGGAGIALLGPLLAVAGGRGWTVDTGLAFYGFLVALLLALRSGLEAQRQLSFDVFLARNFVAPVVHAMAMLLSLALTWGLLVGGTFTALLILSAEPGLAAWHTAAWGLRSAVVIGFVPLVERYSTVGLPMVVPAFGYLLAVVVLSVVIGEGRALDLLVVTDRTDPSTLLPLAGQACLLLAVTSLLFLVLAGRRSRFRSPDRSRDRIVPSRHGDAPPGP